MEVDALFINRQRYDFELNRILFKGTFHLLTPDQQIVRRQLRHIADINDCIQWRETTESDKTVGQVSE